MPMTEYDQFRAEDFAGELSLGETVRLSPKGLTPIASALSARGLGLAPTADGAWTVVAREVDVDF